MTTSATAKTISVIATGVFTAGGVDHMGSKVDTLVFPAGTREGDAVAFRRSQAASAGRITNQDRRPRAPSGSPASVQPTPTNITRTLLMPVAAIPRRQRGDLMDQCSRHNTPALQPPHQPAAARDLELQGIGPASAHGRWL
jgi:hypothetical protein